MKWRRPKGDPTSTEYWQTLGEERAVAEWEQEHGLVNPDEAPTNKRIGFRPKGGAFGQGAFVVQGKRNGEWVDLSFFGIYRYNCDYDGHEYFGEPAKARAAAEKFMRTVGDNEVV